MVGLSLSGFTRLAARLPAALSLEPGLSPTCPLPTCGVAPELQISAETLHLALLFLTVALAQEQSGVTRVKVQGRAGPNQGLLGGDTVRENSGGWGSAMTDRNYFGACT